MWKNENRAQFEACIRDLLELPQVRSMQGISHHNVNCFDHCLFVSYLSFLMSRRCGCDFVAAARGGLLHDLYLDTDNRDEHEWLHLFRHPHAALANAEEACDLTDKERDIIVKHMWPLTFRHIPRYRESLLVSLADKLCAMLEVMHIYHAMHVKKRLVFA